MLKWPPKTFASLLIAILLTTVLSPSFGWELAGSQAPQGHDVPRALDDHDGPPVLIQGGGDTGSHHGCVGHLFGHLQAQPSDSLLTTLLDPADNALPEPTSDFFSVFPERLDRPPLAPHLA